MTASFVLHSQLLSVATHGVPSCLLQHLELLVLICMAAIEENMLPLQNVIHIFSQFQNMADLFVYAYLFAGTFKNCNRPLF